MPAVRASAARSATALRPDDGRETTRRSVVPPAAGRNVWLAAVWTGAGTAVLGAMIAIVVVSICWLPGSQGSGSTTSAVKAGLLTLLAAVHGGITVNGADAAFLPLGLTALLGLIAWRAGAGLADAAGGPAQGDRTRLLAIGAAQTAGFTIACVLLVPLATLGTSSVPFLGVGLFAIILFTLTGGLAFARETGLLSEPLRARSAVVAAGARCAVIGLGCYLTAGALLVAGSLLLHHGRASALLNQVGPGWNGVPIILLSVLAAPNAVIAGAAYLAGPGFAVGSGTAVGITSTTSGVVPAFPVLAALPSGPAPSWMWALVIGVPLTAGALAGAVATRAEHLVARLQRAGVGAALAGLGAAVLAWQGGGGIGDERLSTIGASPLLFGAAVAVELAIGSVLVIAIHAARHARQRPAGTTPVLWATPPAAASTAPRRNALRRNAPRGSDPFGIDPLDVPGSAGSVDNGSADNGSADEGSDDADGVGADGGGADESLPMSGRELDPNADTGRLPVLDASGKPKDGRSGRRLAG
jgi:hypothetical protein